MKTAASEIESIRAGYACRLRIAIQVDILRLGEVCSPVEYWWPGEGKTRFSSVHYLPSDDVKADVMERNASDYQNPDVTTIGISRAGMRESNWYGGECNEPCALPLLMVQYVQAAQGVVLPLLKKERCLLV